MAQSPSFLTEQEQNWLARHPEIRLAPDPQFLPIEYFNEQGQYVGIAADYIALIEQKLGIRFKKINLHSWDKVMQQSRNRQVDIWGAAASTPQRLKYMDFTQPYLSLPAVILVRNKVTIDLSLDTLKGMKVAVISGYGIHDHILNEYPEIQLDVVPDIQTGLKKVSLGLVDAMVTNIALGTTYIERMGLANLRIAGESGYVYKWALASRNDWPELNRILDKALSQITPGERQAIYSRWITLEPHAGESFREIAISLSIVLVILGIGGILFWNRSLTLKVEHRTQELNRELSERRQVEQALRESEAKFKKLFEQLTLIVKGTSTTTGEKFFMSLAYHLSLALKVRYAFVAEMIDHENGVARTLSFWNGIDYSENITYEIENTPCEKVIKGGWSNFPEGVQKLFPEDRFLQEFNVEGYQGIPIKDFSGMVLGHLGVMDDKPIQDASVNQMILTVFASRAFAELERQNTHNHLRRAKEYAEQANKAKSDFLSRASHEFRTPLNAILGFSQLMKMKKDGLDEDQRECLEHIIKSGGLLLELINDLLDLSQIESSRLTLQIEKVQVGSVIQKALDLSSPMAQDRGIQLVSNISNKGQAVVLADKLRLSQVMLNLISNAIKYNEENGTLTVESFPVENGRYRIAVKDTGLGIPKDKLEQIFEPFERLGTESSKVVGSGIGLTICQSLMTLMNGDIKAESSPGKGSCFFIELPLAQEPSGLMRPEPDSASTN